MCKNNLFLKDSDSQSHAILWYCQPLSCLFRTSFGRIKENTKNNSDKILFFFTEYVFLIVCVGLIHVYFIGPNLTKSVERFIAGVIDSRSPDVTTIFGFSLLPEFELHCSRISYIFSDHHSKLATTSSFCSHISSHLCCALCSSFNSSSLSLY